MLSCPAFYERACGGTPERWVRSIEGAIASAVLRFCARRLVKALAEGMYSQPSTHGAPNGAG